MAQISSPDKLFEYKLGTALGLERKVQTMLRMMESQAAMPKLKEGFSRHLEETDQQIRNIEQAIEAIGGDSTAHQDPIIEGIAQQSEQLLGRTDETLLDAVLVGGATHTEHHEIATYEGLITMASAMGAEDVVSLLQENLEQEEKTLGELESMNEVLSQQLVQASA